MSPAPFILDAHSHVGPTRTFYLPDIDGSRLIELMDRCAIRWSICCGDHAAIMLGVWASIEILRRRYEESGGRVPYLGVFDPREGRRCLPVLERAEGWPGFVGLKIHPVEHQTPGDDPSYLPAWEFAAAHGLPIMTHSWSVSDYNPGQTLATPGRFEGWVRRFPAVRLVLGHAGGRGTGRAEAVRMANEYRNVYLDFAGDIYDEGTIPSLAEVLPEGRLLFASDYPWFDPRSHISRVLLSDLDDAAKRGILYENALSVYARISA